MNKSMVEDSGSMGIGNLSFVKTNNQKYRNPSGVMVVILICRLRG